MSMVSFTELWNFTIQPAEIFDKNICKVCLKRNTENEIPKPAPLDMGTNLFKTRVILHRRQLNIVLILCELLHYIF